MPELPEVETVVRTLRPRLTGQLISAVRLHRTDILSPADTDLAAHLLGRRIESIDRRAKRIIITLDNAHRFYIHLGMTGQLTVEPADAPHRPHTHLILDLSSLSPGTPGERVRVRGQLPLPSTLESPSPPSQLRFRDPRRFGGIWYLGPTADPSANLGPEPLTLATKQLAVRLMNTKRPIKSALLDQSLIAGFGNIYVDESLFAANIHPLTPTHRLTYTQVTQLNRAIKKVLRTAIRHRGSTLRDYRDAEGNSGDYQSRHNVYDREDKPCPRCKTPIQRIVLSGRSTCFCPKCQNRKPKPQNR